MSALNSQEFPLAEALIHYYNAEPEHEYGICWWLQSLREEEGRFVIDSAALFSTLIWRGMLKADSGNYSYISRRHGFTKLRAAAARKVVEMLESGVITYHNGWRINGEPVWRKKLSARS